MESVSVATVSPASAAGGEPPDSIKVGYGGSMTSYMGSSFASHLQQAESAAAAGSVEEPSAAAKALFKPLDRIDVEAHELSQYATNAAASGQEMTSSEIIMLTVRSQEFLFHSQLTANVANRTSDGLQQLFKQQG